MVNIGKRIFLQLFIFRQTELCSQSLSCQSGKSGASYPQDQSDDAADHHLQPFSEDILPVS